jgi:hypothetical protein
MGFNILFERAGHDACPGTFVMLTRADFDVAVKEALRHYTRADLLLGSPLLETGIAAAGGPKGAQVARLQQVLAEAAQTIFVNERDHKLQRVLELTYFRPVRNKRPRPIGLGSPSAPIADT